MQGRLLARIEAKTNAISRIAAFVGVVGMLIIGILTAFDVIVLRSIFNAPIAGSNEFLSTIFAVAIAAVLVSGLAQRASLEIDFLKAFVNDRVAAWMRVFGHTLFLAILCLTSWQVVVYSLNAIEIGKITIVLQWPLWPFLLGVSLFFSLCVPVQLVVVLSMIAEELSPQPAEGGDRPGYSGARVATIFAIMFAGAVLLSAAVYAGSNALRPVLTDASTAFSISVFFLLWLLILLFVPIAAALIICAVIGTGVLMGYPTALNILGSETVGLITNEELAVLPLFMIMGAFAGVAGLSSDIYRLAHATFGPFRGGLALASVGGCAGFGALTGSSLATVATIGTVAIPEMKQRGYSMQLSTGSIAAGGTLGQLVPPSTAIVLYAILVEQSIGRLYIAVLIPAALTVLLYTAAIVIWVSLDPKSAPGRTPFNGREFLHALHRCKSVFLMFGIVVGGIYTGFFTATEAAAVGATIAFMIALFRGKLNFTALGHVVGEATRSTSMLYFVIIGAMVISFFFGTSGLPQTLLNSLTGLGLSNLAVIVILIGIFIVLGTIMDAFAIMIVTAGLASAIVQSLGYDPIWWGIMMVILVELGVLTPPFGMNLFVMKALVPDERMSTIFRGVMPFVAADIVKIALLIAFPALILWLPALAFSR
ncbi:TRAP transporter large permease subunit [Pseudorhodoplanes sp.]|uniref:TRAP transporter large permease n=1 Tax=Pseudorhodoplanes sp. TaxID=1934341 RepID=UPI003D139D63